MSHPARMPERPRTCETVSDVCKAPPGGGTPTRATCFGCGLPVCVACSKRVPWYRYGRRRVCVDCLVQHEVWTEDDYTDHLMRSTA